MKRGGWIALAVVAVLVLLVAGQLSGNYNRLVGADQRVKQRWAQVDNQLQRRNDLIGNLVESVKGTAFVARRREISVALDLEVLETDEGAPLARNKQEESFAVHTVFTRFTPVGSCDDYCLAPPEWKDSDRGKRVEKEWRGAFGSWTVPALLDRARRDPGRTRYLPQHRSEFSAAGTSTPMWLDDLPPVEDLAYFALSDAWMPMLALLRDLDGRDDVEIVTGR